MTVGMCVEGFVCSLYSSSHSFPGRFDLGNGAVLLRPSQIVSDGNWHSVTVVR